MKGKKACFPPMCRHQREYIKLTLEALDGAQSDLNRVCRSGGRWQNLTLYAAQKSVVIHKAKVVMILQLFGWEDTDKLRAHLGMEKHESSVYVHRSLC